MPVIEVEDLVKRYDGVPVVDRVSFDVDRGEIFAILGPNGAGKTTTVESIAGLRHPDGGKISVLGLDPAEDVDDLRKVLGIQLQESQMPDRIEVWEALDLYASFYETSADWNELLERLGLAEKRNTRYAKLSGGQKQRLSIALALVGRPEIAILDELTTGLDPKARRDTWAVIEELRDTGVTILLVTHFMEEAERLADRVALIDAGRLVALDTPAGLVARADDEQRIARGDRSEPGRGPDRGHRDRKRPTCADFVSGPEPGGRTGAAGGPGHPGRRFRRPDRKTPRGHRLLPRWMRPCLHCPS
jgi:ABC-2 type transport system ATP-binding protein